MGIYSQLDAVNYILVSAGERPVNTIESEEGIDTSVASFVFNMARKSAISRGINNNVYTKIFPKETTGLVYLPSSVLNVRNITQVYDSTTGIADNIHVISGPMRLYNLTKQTDVFIEDMELEVTVDIVWDNIETNLQKGIMAMAARDYQAFTLGDPQVDNFLAQREALYFAKGRAQDIKDKGRNLFSIRRTIQQFTRRMW